MGKLKNDRFIRALKREPVDKTPIWIMRQAGRYLPEYRKLRSEVGDFLKLLKDPKLACEVTLQPLARFDLDAAIIFSDILTVPDAMGLGLYFETGKGPRFKKPIVSQAAVKSLPIPDKKELSYVTDAIKLVVKQLKGKVPLIGFSGSPWTLATYMIEDGFSKTFSKTKKWLYANPNDLHDLLTKLTQGVAEHLIEQVNAGVSALQIFDTWGGVLTPITYRDCSLHYMRKIIKQVKEKHPDIPIILFTKNGGQWLESIANSGCDAIGIDWTTDLADAKQRVGDKVALQGNMDPAVLFSTPEYIQKEVKSILSVYNGKPGHVFNLGHGIDQSTPVENVQALVEAVHQ